VTFARTEHILKIMNMHLREKVQKYFINHTGKFYVVVKVNHVEFVAAVSLRLREPRRSYTIFSF
jgi:hypothetical protein